MNKTLKFLTNETTSSILTNLPIENEEDLLDLENKAKDKQFAHLLVSNIKVIYVF